MIRIDEIIKRYDGFAGEKSLIQLHVEPLKKYEPWLLLDKALQSDKWHQEGTAWEHTKRVALIAASSELIDIFGLTEDEREIVLYAALCHDLGKGVTTFQDDKGVWHSYGHEVESEKITRQVLPLFVEDGLPYFDDETIELIATLTRWHMYPLQIKDSKDKIAKLKKVASKTNLKLLLCLKWCDSRGSVMESYDGCFDFLKYLWDLAKDNDLI
jgi:tRNA nucleotidyltransferase (CCA-adding enzyme)